MSPPSTNLWILEEWEMEFVDVLLESDEESDEQTNVYIYLDWYIYSERDYNLHSICAVEVRWVDPECHTQVTGVDGLAGLIEVTLASGTAEGSDEGVT